MKTLFLVLIIFRFEKHRESVDLYDIDGQFTVHYNILANILKFLFFFSHNTYILFQIQHFDLTLGNSHKVLL